MPDYYFGHCPSSWVFWDMSCQKLDLFPPSGVREERYSWLVQCSSDWNCLFLMGPAEQEPMVSYLRLGLSVWSSWVVNFPILHLSTETDPDSETLCFKKVKTMDGVQNSRHVYCDTIVWNMPFLLA
jgi:hypothetical protein